MNLITGIVMDVYRLECLFFWALLTAVENAIGDQLSGDAKLKLDQMKMGALYTFESPGIIPEIMRRKIVYQHLLGANMILFIYLSAAVNKALGI